MTPAHAGPPAGCGCTLEVYRRELDEIRKQLDDDFRGTSDEAQAATAAWGINPCTVGPLSHFRRYAFDFPTESTAKCNLRCEQEPWNIPSGTWKACISGKRVSVQVPTPASNCETMPGRYVEGGKCYFDKCANLKPCRGEDRESCETNCNDCQMLATIALRHRDYQCFSVEPLETYYPHGNHAQQNSIGTAGTHSLVKLVPLPGSVAELMAPKGFAADALERVQLRRITAQHTMKQTDGKVDREELTLTPERKDDFSMPLELLPHRFFPSPKEIVLSSGCHFFIPTNPDNRAHLIDNLNASLTAYYELLRGDACRGKAGAQAEYDEALKKVLETTERYSAGLAEL